MLFLATLQFALATSCDGGALNELEKAYASACQVESAIQYEYLDQVIQDLSSLRKRLGSEESEPLRLKLGGLERARAELEEEREAALAALPKCKDSYDYDCRERHEDTYNSFGDRFDSLKTSQRDLVEQFTGVVPSFSIDAEWTHRKPLDGLIESFDDPELFYRGGEGKVILTYGADGSGEILWRFNHDAQLAQALMFSRETDKVGRLRALGSNKVTLVMSLPDGGIKFSGETTADSLSKFLEQERAICLENRMYWPQKILEGEPTP